MFPSWYSVKCCGTVDGEKGVGRGSLRSKEVMIHVISSCLMLKMLHSLAIFFGSAQEHDVSSSVVV